MTLKELRKKLGLTQVGCAGYLRVPLRTYKRYESDENKVNPVKMDYMLGKLSEYDLIDEEHGILTVAQIKEICGDVFRDFDVDYCYLFGSYAKGTANEKSDVDLLVAMPLDGMKFYELVETLRERLRKKVDLLDAGQLNNNPELIREIMKNGVKMYG